MKATLIGRLSVIAASVVMLAGTAVAAETAAAAPSANISQADEARMIDELVRKAAADGFRIDPADYEVRVDAYGDAIVQPKGALVETSKTDRSVTVTTASTPDPDLARKQVDRVTVQQEPEWQEPQCFGRFTHGDDDENIGYMDNTCAWWGSMNYAAATRDNWVLRFTSSCGATGDGPPTSFVFSCSVATIPHRFLSPEMVWNGREPRSAKATDRCESYPLSLTVGPFTAGVTLNACEEIVPILGDYVGRHEVYWSGFSNELSEVRETGLLIGVGVERGVLPYLLLHWSYRYCREFSDPQCLFSR